MSISRTAYLSLAALLAIAPAACGGDDDGDDGGGAADSGGGGQADAGGGEADAGGGEADAGGGEADAAPTVEGDEYLLGVALPGTPLGDGLLRLIATVDVADDGTSADFALQPIFSPNCPDNGKSGIPTGDALVQTGVALKKGAFALQFTEVPIVTGTLGAGDGTAGCELDLVLTTLDVTGTVVKTGFCGNVVAAVAGLGELEGTFGTVPIKAGTVGDDLPAEVTACE